MKRSTFALLALTMGCGAAYAAANDSAGLTFECSHLRTPHMNEVSAVTGACLAVRRKVFAELGGFDPALAVACNDVLLCVEALKRGYRNIYLARPLLIHH